MLFKILTIVLCFSLNMHAKYYSQYNQDRFINEQFIHNKQHGFFVDIGAHDGSTYSNTYFFEKELNWKGICFEPLDAPFQKLVATRPHSTCLQACVAATAGELEFFEVQGYSEMLSGIVRTYHPKHLARLKREVAQYGGSYRTTKVPSLRFNDVMKAYNVQHIDLLSIDTEGSEFEILQSIDFAAVSIDVLLVENNYKLSEIRSFLEAKGYRFVIHKGDEIYIKENL